MDETLGIITSDSLTTSQFLGIHYWSKGRQCYSIELKVVEVQLTDAVVPTKVQLSVQLLKQRTTYGIGIIDGYVFIRRNPNRDRTILTSHPLDVVQLLFQMPLELYHRRGIVVVEATSQPILLGEDVIDDTIVFISCILFIVVTKEKVGAVPAAVATFIVVSTTTVGSAACAPAVLESTDETLFVFAATATAGSVIVWAQPCRHSVVGVPGERPSKRKSCRETFCLTNGEK